MALVNRKSEEDKLAERGQKEQQKAAEQAEKEQRRAAQEREKAENAFQTSPAGRARTAFQRGDQLLQVVFDVVNTSTYVIPMSRAGTTTASSDPTVILNSICAEGWDLVNASFVFHETGSESRDKFMRSGQQIAVQGSVLGYYVFRRSEANRRVE